MNVNVFPLLLKEIRFKFSILTGMQTYAFVNGVARARHALAVLIQKQNPTTQAYDLSQPHAVYLSHCFHNLQRTWLSFDCLILVAEISLLHATCTGYSCVFHCIQLLLCACTFPVAKLMKN